MNVSFSHPPFTSLTSFGVLHCCLLQQIRDHQSIPAMSDNPGRVRDGSGRRGGRGGAGGPNASRRPSRDDIQQINRLNFTGIIDRYQATRPCERCGDFSHSLLACTRGRPKFPTFLWERIMEINTTAEANAHITSLQRGGNGLATNRAPRQNTGRTGVPMQPTTHLAFETQGNGARSGAGGWQGPGSMNTLSAGFGSLATNAPSWRPNLPFNGFAQNTAASDRGTSGRGSGTDQRGGNRGNYAGRTSTTPLATFTGEMTYPT